MNVTVYLTNCLYIFNNKLSVPEFLQDLSKEKILQAFTHRIIFLLMPQLYF